MKKLLLIFFTFSFSFFTSLQVQAQSWLWARQGRNHTTLNDEHAIAMDSYHNAYLTGSYSSDTLIWGNDTLLAPPGAGRETFLVKYDENGNLLWIRSSKSTTNLYAQSQSVATDLHNNVYITGNFNDTLYFQSYAVYNQYNPLVFVTKYDANGNVLWAKQCTRASGRGNVNIGEGIAVDKSGNVYVTGYFGDTISFGSQTLKTLYIGTFLVKYDSNGNVIWARQSNSSNYDNGSNAIAIDKSGAIYVSGYFQDTIIFGNHKLIASGLYESYVVKYDSNGNVIWDRQSNSANTQSYAEGYGICTDKKNNVYTTGILNDTVNFGATTLVGRNQYYSIYWTKYDSAGDIKWAKQSYSVDSLAYQGWSINTDASENIYLTGFRDALDYSNAKVVFDYDTLQLNHAGDPFIFIKMDSTGSVLNGYIFASLPGAGGLEPLPLAVDSSGCYVYYGGGVDTSVVFGSDTLGTSVNPLHIDWPFIARWSPGECATGSNDTKSTKPGIHIYPNPTNKLLNINFNEQIHGPATLSIMDITGRMVLHSSFTIYHLPLVMDVSSLTTGMYFITVNINGNKFNKKFIKINTL